MKLLMKATLVLAMGAVSLMLPEPAAAASLDEPCWVIANGICGGDWEAACLQYCGIVTGDAFCVDRPEAQDPDTAFCTGGVS
jgi:hypothetical protein